MIIRIEQAGAVELDSLESTIHDVHNMGFDLNITRISAMGELIRREIIRHDQRATSSLNRTITHEGFYSQRVALDKEGIKDMKH